MAGIRSAAACSDGVELDFRRSGSGDLVLSHDPGISGVNIPDVPTTELRRLKPDLATAEELFLADLSTSLDLEVKNSPFEPGFEADHRIALEVAERCRPTDLVTCFFWPTVDAVRIAYPDVHTGLLFEEQVDWRVAVGHAVNNGHRTIAPHYKMIDHGLVEAAAMHSLQIATWTVNDPEQVIELADLGVHTIITNRPAEAVGWIQEYRQ